MNLNSENSFDLSILSLEELLNVYGKVDEFLDFLESKKIELEEDGLNDK